ncbi:ABC transporter ATP-binding protein [Paenibacillus sp. 1011MAR3C5]|uniref:ABC transporter ATP-binding protein n=1 Tax=Paenibacillus sp. 1011MAR3C5 TaxID=1675787 RepID=UPI000E6BDA5D|nr:ABC transporter ATP-binding protein [Paenibacillus sp. 1011MAR3C5]RJE87771.1 ABC transporter ATP-binding protein [Paenibacillus sp. 1011MAR3C5]
MSDWQAEQAIQFSGVAQRKPNFKLGPITLDIPKGFITAIVGPNGSGKSTLFRMVLDLEKPQEGTVTVLDHPMGTGDDAPVKQRIGYLPEESLPHDDKLKAYEKARFNSYWYKDWDVNRYQELLLSLQVNDNLLLGKMSKGMRRKCEFALALAHAPDLLLLDEPSSGLDPLAWKSMIEILHRYMELGDRTILMTSHIVEEVKRLADYIVFMAQGRVLGVYEKDELFSSWFTFFVSGEGLNTQMASRMPGQCGIESIGGQSLRITTSEAFQAEQWCETEGITILSKQALELDEILSTLLQQDGISKRVHEARGKSK